VAVAWDARVITPMYLEGTYALDPRVVDADVTYDLPAFTVDLTPHMLPWDIMRIVAQYYAGYSIMDDLGFAVLEPADDRRLLVALFSAPGVVLTDDEAARLPWDEDC
jgi:hypothetical protein